MRNDKPAVKGITGMRDWKDTKSDFCVAKKVEAELETLIKLSRASAIVLSYNNEGLLTKDQILKLMGK